MLTIDNVKDIRNRFFRKRQSISKIANECNMDRKTVQKYVDMNDFNEQEPKPILNRSLCPKLDPYKSKIGRLDRDYMIEAHCIRGLKKMNLFGKLSGIIMPAMAKAHIKKANQLCQPICVVFRLIHY